MMAASVESPRGADALHKMAATAETRADENTPANGHKPTKTTAKSKQQQSESDDDEDDDDDENKAAKDGDADKGDDDDKKTSKKSRRELPPHTVAILKGWMLSPEHVKHPYPTDEDKQMLLKKTGINMKQLTNWFTNARKRIWKPMMRREHSRQLQTAMEYEKTRGPGFPVGAPPAMAAYRDGPYPPRAAIRHSFDGGSLGPPGHPREPMGYHHPYDMPPPMATGPQGYPVAPPPPHAYPPRVMRSVSESAKPHDMDDYIDAMRIRKRVHEMAPEGLDADGMGHADKRFRRGGAMLSPRCLQILQEWVAGHAHMEYPVPGDSDKLQLSRDTGLDVQQIELWFKTNVGRFGAPLQSVAPPPQQQQQQPPPGAMPHGHPAYRSIPSRDNSIYPPPPAYGERRSIPSQGNPMFPPRPAVRSSVPGPGNSQFPPPPAVRRDSSDGYRGGMPPPGYPGAGGGYPPPLHSQGYESGDPARPMRTLSINSAQYPPPVSQGAPQPSIPAPVGAPPGSSGLPSLTGRPVPGAPGGPGGRPGPPMGQARDSRSHTLDMGQFADARRRKMNFQDILASTSSQQQIVSQVAAGAPRPPANGAGFDPKRPPNAENVYPTEMAAPYAQKMYDPSRGGMVGQPGSTAMASNQGSATVDAQVQGRI